MEERLRRWLSAFSTRLLTPLITGYSRFLERVALSPFRDGLGPFLATRPVMCGAGTWAARRGDDASALGAFSLSPWASRMERCIGTGLAITSMIELKSLSSGSVFASMIRWPSICGPSLGGRREWHSAPHREMRPSDPGRVYQNATSATSLKQHAQVAGVTLRSSRASG